MNARTKLCLMLTGPLALTLAAASPARAEPPPVQVEVLDPDAAEECEASCRRAKRGYEDFFDDAGEEDRKQEAELEEKTEGDEPAGEIGEDDRLFLHAKKHWNRFWRAKPGVDKGSVMVSLHGGESSAGRSHGAAVEVLLTDRLGVRFAGTLDWIRGGEIVNDQARRWRTWDFADGRWAGDWSNPSFDDGIVHLEDLGLTLHVLERGHFDLYGSLSASHFGYTLFRDGDDTSGGAAYLRAGLGLNFFIRRFYVGVEAGWYGLELFRYAAGSPDGGHHDVTFESSPSGRDNRRLTASALIGLRFD